MSKKSLLDRAIIVSLVSLFFWSCDTGVAAPETDPVIPAFPVIPAEFGEMLAIPYTGADPAEIDDLYPSMDCIRESIFEPVDKLLNQTSDHNLGEIIYLILYRERPDFVDSDFDSLTLNGTVSSQVDEELNGVTLTASDLWASLTHEKLLEITPDGDYLTIEPAKVSDPESGDPLYLFQNGSFDVSLGVSDFDLRLTDAPYSDSITTEYLRCLADISLTAGGNDLTLDELTEGAMVFESGELYFDINAHIRIGMVLSSDDPGVRGCKAVLSFDLEDSLTEFNLSGLDVNNDYALVDALLDISSPVVNIDVFAGDNTYLFSETVLVSQELETLF